MLLQLTCVFEGTVLITGMIASRLQAYTVMDSESLASPVLPPQQAQRASACASLLPGVSLRAGGVKQMVPYH